MDLEFLTLCSNSYNSYTSTSAYLYILWLFNIAMENGPFIDDFPIKTSIYKGFSMAMLNNQMVILLFYLLQLLIRVLGYPTWHSLVSRSESTQKRSKHFHDKQIEKSMATWMINFKPNPAHINIIYIYAYLIYNICRSYHIILYYIIIYI